MTVAKQIGRREAATRVVQHRAETPTKPRTPKPRTKPTVEQPVSALKQPGRRYGPAPKAAPKHRQSPAPMRSSARVAAYQRQNGRLLALTARQRRQINRMSLRAARSVTQ